LAFNAFAAALAAGPSGPIRTTFPYCASFLAQNPIVSPADSLDAPRHSKYEFLI
jgi:hypothetical protein